MAGDEQRTREISGDRLARLRERHRRSTQARLALTLYHRDGVQVVPLTEGAPVVLGRFPPSDVVIRDDSLSRRHARIEVEGDLVWVEDLGSTNGTFVDDQQVERTPAPNGAEIFFGAVCGVVHTMEAGIGTPESHDRFSVDLQREVARAREHARPLALAMFRPLRSLPATRWIPRVCSSARAFDVVGLYSADTLELLRPEGGYDEAVQLATALVNEGEPLLAGVASFPDHAGSADGLLAAARDALRAATPGSPVSVAPGASTVGPRPERHEDPIFASPVMKRLEQIARRLADSAIPVLITGETGVGKEVLATLVARSGRRRAAPVVTVNCGGMPESLLESTLFGHVRGAFTGATRDRAGVFEAADGGTLFLDEVGELSPSAQSALLRVLETGRFCRVGSTDEVFVNVRVVTATHQDLEARAEKGQFRRDLLYRLNAMTLDVPPLRERAGEIPLLVERFVGLANAANQTVVRGLSDDAMSALLDHSWPGNVRELRNAIDRAVVIACDDLITVEDLPRTIRAVAPSRESTAAVDGDPSPPLDLRDDLARYEARRIRQALDATDWRRDEAAERLGLPVRTLYRKMRQYGLLD